MGNGMKSGSGEDPFADVETDNDDSGPNSAPEEAAIDDTEGNNRSNSESESSSGYPWLFTRNNAKDGREMVQFFLQQESQALESRAQADLEEMLGEEPLLLDVREAAYQVALEQHLDDVATQLREWGYDIE